MENGSRTRLAGRGRAPGLGAADIQTRGFSLREPEQEFVIFNLNRTGIALARSGCLPVS